VSAKMADAKRKKVSEEAIEKKLLSFNSTQESVQALSLWIMHNKAHHQKIVDTWLKVLKKCKCQPISESPNFFRF